MAIGLNSSTSKRERHSLTVFRPQLNQIVIKKFFKINRLNFFEKTKASPKPQNKTEHYQTQRISMHLQQTTQQEGYDVAINFETSDSLCLGNLMYVK